MNFGTPFNEYFSAIEKDSTDLMMRSEHTTQDIKVLEMADILDRFIGQRTVHYLTINVEGYEYSIFDEIDRKILSRQGIVFCQIDAEFRHFWSEKAEAIEKLFNRFNSPTSHYIPIFTTRSLERQKVTFINIRSRECSNAFNFSNYFK